MLAPLKSRLGEDESRTESALKFVHYKVISAEFNHFKDRVSAIAIELSTSTVEILFLTYLLPINWYALIFDHRLKMTSPTSETRRCRTGGA